MKTFGQKRWLDQDMFKSGTVPIATELSRMGPAYVAHDHSFVELALIAEGTGIHQSQRATHRIQPGSLIVIRPGVWHAFPECKEMIIFNCCVGFDLLQHELLWLSEMPLLNSLLWSGPLSPTYSGVLSLTLSGRDTHRCKEEWLDLQRICKTRKSGNLTIMGGLLRYLDVLASSSKTELNRLFPVAPVSHVCVSTVIRSIEQKLAFPWTLEEFTRLVRVSPIYLTRVFKAHTGLSPIQYLTRCRAERAATLLSTTSRSIKDIGLQVGWEDPNYFARCFRKVHGIPASKYREKLSHA